MVNTINDSVFEETESSFTNNDSFIKQDSRIQRKTMCPPESYNYIKTELDDDNSEVIEILEANINEIKNLLNIFLDSIFSTIYNLPLHIRLFLKLIEKRINEKFTIAKEDLHLIFSNFIFLKWIIPKFSMPVFTSLGFDTEFKNSQMKNLMLLGGILHKIVKLSFYDNSASDFIPFNDFIEENKYKKY